MWKTVLKEIRMDKEANCCEEARVSIIGWFERQMEILKAAAVERDFPNLIQRLEVYSQKLSEEPCSKLYSETEDFIDKCEQTRENLFELDKLKDIMSEWDDCKKEPEEVKVKEQNPAMDNFPLFQEDPSAWMNQYIRGRN